MTCHCLQVTFCHWPLINSGCWSLQNWSAWRKRSGHPCWLFSTSGSELLSAIASTWSWWSTWMNYNDLSLNEFNKGINCSNIILRLLPMVNINHCRNSIKHDQSVLLTLISFSLYFMRRWYCIYHHLAIHFGNLRRFWKGFAVPEILQCTCNINKSAQRQLHIEIPRLSVSNAGTIWLKVGLRLGKMSCFTGPVVVMLMMLSLSQMGFIETYLGTPSSFQCNIDDAQSESDFMQSFLPLNHISLFFSTPTGPKCKYVAGWCARPRKQQS